MLLALTACSSDAPNDKGGHGKKPATPVDTTVSPLTGLHQDGSPKNAAFMVKIENTHSGQPQYGVDKADLVVEELVEGGYTRLAAFFYSELPTKVGHVRSARTTDIDLAEPIDATILASGGAPKTLRTIGRSLLPYYSYDKRSPGWSTDPSMHPPYHVLWNLQTLANEAKPYVPPKSYFRFAEDGPAVTTKQTTHASVKFSPATTTDWAFSGETWARSPERAASGQAFKADTLAVIFAPVKDAGYRDPAGNAVPETVVEGVGRAVIFTGSDATEAIWRKKNRNSTMTFKSKTGGKAIGLKPGHVWLELVPTGGSINY